MAVQFGFEQNANLFKIKLQLSFVLNLQLSPSPKPNLTHPDMAQVVFLIREELSMGKGQTSWFDTPENHKFYRVCGDISMLIAAR